MPGSEYCVFPNADEDSGSEGEEEEDDYEVDEDAFHLVWAHPKGEGIKHKEIPKRKRAIRQFKKKAGNGRSIVLCKGGEILRFRGDGDEDGGEFDDQAQKELAFIIGATFGRGIASGLGLFENGGAHPLLEGYEDDDDDDVDSDA